MSATGYDVDPAALETLARLVDGRASTLRSAAGRFEGPALAVHDAFGWLGPSPDVLRDYLELAQGCVEALGDLGATLDSITLGLDASAGAYRQAEEANTAGG